MPFPRVIIAHHIILTGYGHWLPNDPRGSMSQMMRQPSLEPLGDIHYGRKRVHPSRKELKAFRIAARPLLTHPVLWFEHPHRQALIDAIRQSIRSETLTCYACAVLSNHIHLLIRRHRLDGPKLNALLKDSLAETLHEEKLVPPEHPVFSADSCHFYKSDKQAVRNCIGYINENFAKHHLPLAVYDFVTPYDDWPPKMPG
ncbi:MAG: hypothetical protein BWX88_04170 [Planctomycetes bacterium ADurb.Bin126]|nr:MAG: hypothetical protein BWX88_04170 [Planctomycetes bacterium ADurb.Bin126]